MCVVDEAGKLNCESKAPTEPDDIAALLRTIGDEFVRVGIEAGPLSKWLVNGLTEAQQIKKSDRNDARGIVQMMRVDLFKTVRVKSLAAQEQRMLV